MKKLIHINRVPYGGEYVLNRPDLGMVGSGSSFVQLEGRVRAYRHANSIPTGLGFQQELMQVVCEKYPQECTDAVPGEFSRPHKLGLNDVVLGTRIAFSMVSKGLSGETVVVDDAEANRRAEICAQCAFNVPFTKPCGGYCGELRDLVRRLVGNKEVKGASNLGACFLCHCFLESAVWVRLDIQVNPMPAELKAKFEAVERCWKKASLIKA